MYQVILVVQWINVLLVLMETWIVFRKMQNQLHHYLFMSCVASLIYSTGYLLSLYCHTEDAYFQAMMMSWAGKVWTVATLFFFYIELCRIKIPYFMKVALGIFAVATYVVVITTRTTGLFYADMEFTLIGELPAFRYGRGPWYYVWNALVSCVIFSGLAILFRTLALEKSQQKKKQLRLVTAALLTETLIGALVFHPVNVYYDFTQIGISVSAILVLIAIFRYDLMDMELVAQEYMIDELTAGVIATDVSGSVAYYNKAALEIFPELPMDAQRVLEQVQEAVRSGAPFSVLDRIYTFEERTLLQGGHESGKLYVLTDATMQYHYLQDLEEQKQIADEANQAKSDFLARMSHDIRTPINAVLGLDEMILRESTERVIKGYAMDIQTAGNTLLTIINDILDLTKVESGEMEIVPVAYDVSAMIYGLSHMFLNRARDKGISFEVSVDPEIPVRLWGDDVRIKQVLLNLLSNAIKYTRSGEVWLRITQKPDEEGYTTLHFEVEDTGIGIRPEDMERTQTTAGTGLGLPITIELLSLMDSSLEVESEYGKGSVFSFDLRQKITDPTPIGDFAKRISHPASEQYTYNASFTAPYAHVLIVDDNSMNRKVVVSLLKQTQIQFAEAASGQQAVALAGRQHFDLILMDHMMPGMDGVEAMHKIREIKDGPCADTPIVVLTANAVVGSKEKYLEEGFDGFLSKPVDYGKLEAIIRETLPEDMLITFTGGTVYAGDDMEDFPVIYGLDWNIAMMRIQSKEILETVLTEFVNTVEAQADKLQRLRDGLPKTFDDYRIMVHGMKSASNVTGIYTLAGMAATLEKAASEKDMDTIEKLHDIFLREWRSYKERLSDYAAEEEPEEDKEELDGDVLNALLDMLVAAMDEVDIDGADDAIKKLSSYRLPEHVAAEFDHLKEAVAQLDQDLLAETMDRIAAAK